MIAFITTIINIIILIIIITIIIINVDVIIITTITCHQDCFLNYHHQSFILIGLETKITIIMMIVTISVIITIMMSLSETSLPLGWSRNHLNDPLYPIGGDSFLPTVLNDQITLIIAAGSPLRPRVLAYLPSLSSDDHLIPPAW